MKRRSGVPLLTSGLSADYESASLGARSVRERSDWHIG
jgi:hypothetical protein